MDQKKTERKPLRLKYHDYNRAGTYFVTVCTKDKACILSEICKQTVSATSFSSVGDGVLDVPKTKLTDIGKIVEKHLLNLHTKNGVLIDQYVLMPNHIHILIVLQDLNENGTSRTPSPTNARLPRLISTLKRFCNKEIGYNIFQRSYIEHVVRDQKDYETRKQYILENPLRWYYKE